MRRRELIRLVASTIAVSPFAANAQRAASRPLIAYLAEGTEWNGARWIGFLKEGLQSLGYVEGRDFDFVARFADGYVDRLPALAEELVRIKPQILVAGYGNAAIALRNATTTIPIVCPAFGLEGHAGLVASLAHPGGNLTGITTMVDGVYAKQLEFARELVPTMRKVGLLGNFNESSAPSQRQELEEAARAMGIRVIPSEVRTPDDIEAAIEALAREPVQAVILLSTIMMIGERRKIVPLMAAKRLPAVYYIREFVDIGGLISYGIDGPWSYRRAATFVDKILKGATPGDLPVEQPTKYELVINLKTARALGLTIPQALFARADEVIE